MRKAIRMLLLPLLLTGMLSACGDHRNTFTPTAEATALSVGYEVFKSRVEHRLQMTCNLENLVVEGTYCVSNYKPTDRQEVYCFKTLGGVDCYAEPDPYSLEGRQLPGPPRALADPRMPMTPPGRRTPPQVATAPYYNGYAITSTPAAASEAPAIVVPAEPPVTGQSGMMAPTGAAPAATTPGPVMIMEPVRDPATRPM